MTFSKLRSVVSTTSAAFLLCAASLFAQTPSFVSFDAPDAGTQSGQGTYPSCINGKGVIAGVYVDGTGNSHGFVRATTGIITEFTPPNLALREVTGINRSGEVVGYGYGAHEIIHGFLRTAGGHFTQVVVPGAVSTLPRSINDSGQIAGQYVDNGPAAGMHAFIREANGSYITFDDPASGGNSNFTIAVAINNNGADAGYYNDATTAAVRGFVRDQFGNFTNFDAVPGGSIQMATSSINLGGAVTGTYSTTGTSSQGFVRDSSGTVTIFSVPSSFNTNPTGINDSGTIVGWWTDHSHVGFSGGFMRDASGKITKVSPPVPNLASFILAINNGGRTAGEYEDTNRVTHGFVR